MYNCVCWKTSSRNCRAAPQNEFRWEASLSLVLAAMCVRAAEDVIARFDEGDALKVTVLSIMGKDLVVAVEADHDA